MAENHAPLRVFCENSMLEAIPNPRIGHNGSVQSNPNIENIPKSMNMNILIKRCSSRSVPWLNKNKMMNKTGRNTGNMKPIKKEPSSDSCGVITVVSSFGPLSLTSEDISKFILSYVKT